MEPAHFLSIFSVAFLGAVVWIAASFFGRTTVDDDCRDLYEFPLEPMDYELMSEQELMDWRNGNRRKLGLPPIVSVD